LQLNGLTLGFIYIEWYKSLYLAEDKDMKYDQKRYRKIRSDRFLSEIQNGQWERVLSTTDDKQKMKDSCILLKHFEGYFIKIDGIICQLREINIPPRWSFVVIEKGIFGATLGGHYNIYLPLKS